MGTTIVALGGNALGLTPAEQLAALTQAAAGLVEMSRGGSLVIAHGNGPQVGQIERAFTMGSAVDPGVPSIDLPEMVAMSQGYIGDHIVRVIAEELGRRDNEADMPSQVAAVVTRVRVDAGDPAFSAPTKPIGPFLTADIAARRGEEHPDHVYGEDAGRGWRRLVASPRPVEVLEVGAVRALVAAGFITVACGGGGIPVIAEDAPLGEAHQLRAVDAVIDKDHSAALLAHQLAADTLVICTAVHRVAIGWGTDRQEWLKDLSVDKAREYMEAGEFAAGSMLPKVAAAVDFVAGAPKGRQRRAVICALSDAGRALSGQVGTVFHSE
ncbi:MAG: carbamate kinase [Actinomycetaceae bacterium]|nr:carbamate kinase [Actinomycetaceae bacterium]